MVWLGFLTDMEARSREGWTDWLDDLAKARRVTQLTTSHGMTLWAPAELLPHVRAVWPDAGLEPQIAAPASVAQHWEPERALIELVRGRLEGQGPTTLPVLAATFGLETETIKAALISLETEGFALAGHFTPGGADREWCERRLLARIHRYTINRLRAEIQPVSARDYLRFLFEWQSVTSDARKMGADALGSVIDQLAGVEAPAAAWERDILPARLADYSPEWLDDACLSGRVAWMRTTPANGKSKSNGRRIAPLKSTPISLLPRRDALTWGTGPSGGDAVAPSANATEILDFIRENGASFFEELVEGTPLLRAQVEDGLAELVALGLVRSDGFAGLRALLSPRHGSRSPNAARRRKASLDGAGRWALASPKLANGSAATEAERVEQIARTLLRRYGVVFLRMLEREAGSLPKWRDLLRVYRQLEARGEMRGGRFVAGFSGEQFALPEAVAQLRSTRRQDDDGALVSLSGADPLNLAGILMPGPKLPAVAGNRVLFRDGIPIAFLEAGEVRFLEQLDASVEAQARMALMGHPQPAPHLQSRAQRASLEKKHKSLAPSLHHVVR
jgi:ATP-dependent Lhr-like helicase